MDGYHESLKAIEKAAAEIFATAETEEEVRELERAICNEIFTYPIKGTGEKPGFATISD